MLKIDPVALTDVGRKRDHNEDYLGDLLIRSGRSYGADKLAERGYLFAVADGMGGHAAGEVASELAITTLFQEYYNGPGSGNIARDLARAVALSNLEVHTAGNTAGRGQMGTTLTLALLKGNRALVGNVGDSRTYLIRQGVPLRVTHDHSLVQDQIDIGALTPEQAEHSAIRNVITRAIGHRSEVDADFFEQELEVGDVLLLCSDGLHGLVKEPEMGATVATTPVLKEAAQNLIDLANSRGGNDNISVVLIKVLEVGEALPTLLDNRETAQVALSDKTAPIANYSHPAADSGPLTVKGKGLDEATDRFIPPGKGTTITELENRPTVPTAILPPSIKAKEPAKESRAGALILSLAVLFLIVGFLLLYFLVLSPANTTATPAPTVRPVVTTTAPITTTVAAVTTSAPLPTVTPAPGGAGLQVTPELGSTPSRARSLDTPSPTP